MSKAEKNTEAILSGNMITAILSLAIPIVINNFIQTMYNLTDTYWLGKLGTNEMASISLVTPMQNIIINFGAGLTLAGSILISQYVGARDKKNAQSMANHIFICSMVFALICGLICFLTTPAIVTWLGANETIHKMGTTYLRIVITDLPFLFMINIYSAVNQAQGDTIRPMKLNMLGIILNMIFDPLFIMVFKWGIAGAALATMIAKVPCALIAVISLFNSKNEIAVNLKKFKFNSKMLYRILSVGLPTAIGNSTMQFGFLLMTKNVLTYGNNAMAAYGIGNRINGIITMPANAMGSAAATIAGQNIGAKQLDRAVDSYKKSRIISVAFLFGAGFILSRSFVSTSVVKIFSSDGNVIPMAAEFLSIMALWCWTNGIYNTTVGLFNGAGNTIVTMIVDAARLWVFRFATLFIFSHFFHMAEQSVWYSVVASNGISALIMYICYKLGWWKWRIPKDIINDRMIKK
ncbi:MAG: MATE family efflux transporter [Clostridia bacterium]|nr:MATE family efflux transporter [Clostridia bacterium]